MKKKRSFFINTLKAGIFFAMPIIVSLFIILKIIHLLTPFSHYVKSKIDPHGLIAFPLIIFSVLIILILFFIAGMIDAWFKGNAKFIVWIEENVLVLLPGYQLIKSTAMQSVGLELSNDIKVVIVPTDGWSLGLLMEELMNDEVLVYIPGAPNPNEGNLNIFKKSEVKSSNLTPKDVYAILKKTGIGTRSYFTKENFSQVDNKKV